ncbi:TerC family protein [Exiguobacterium oxidotolerans]|uniref:Putative manganese-related ion transporter n=1 Tax=Exiguobacterium oxidotolerans TaxID=223958 RepID=A0A653IHS1_9BACL|nr:TerC family protein [Exiguobacterium oxidotolerans]VWX38317.1 putative manganese-related ion transporter [Exiguobacterium oxidotolerans]
MDWQLVLQYAWVVVVLIALEGLLSADNALVLAVMVKHLPGEQQKKALFYGLAGAFVLRFAALFAISFLVDIWQIQALGAAYLLIMGLRHIYKTVKARRLGENHGADSELDQEPESDEPVSKAEFWKTVVKIEFADLAFAVDSILAAVALAVALPDWGTNEIGGLNAGHFVVILTGGLMGVVLMRFAARVFVRLLAERPGLETAAFAIVAWVGVKLAVLALEHPKYHASIEGTIFEAMKLPEGFAHSTPWQAFFWTVMVGLAVWGWFSSPKTKPNPDAEKKVDQHL